MLHVASRRAVDDDRPHRAARFAAAIFSSLFSAPVHGWRDLFREPAHGWVRARRGTAWFPIDHASAHYLVSFREPA
jgi:hypothetical protein